jgi:hypothetical protein
VYIYSTVAYGDAFASNGSFYNAHRPLLITDPANPPNKIPNGNGPPIKADFYRNKPMNFYQAQCIKVAYDVSELDRVVEIRK